MPSDETATVEAGADAMRHDEQAEAMAAGDGVGEPEADAAAEPASAVEPASTLEPTSGGEASGKVEASGGVESDDLVEQAMAAVAPQRQAFRSALALTIDEVRSRLDAGSGGEDQAGPRTGAELGPFASGRIDPERFARLTARKDSAGDAWLEPARRALDTLRAVAARGDELFRVRVEPGGDVYASVDRALAEAGRAFGAARLADLARAGRYVPAEHDSMLASYPFRRWKAAERAKAPPLVIELEGRDAVVGGLAGFLDGTVRLVLVIRGATPPAPLVRLVTPGILVVQTSDPGDLAPLEKWAGPAIAALVPPEAGAFLHDPVGGRVRVEVVRIPENEPKRSLGQISAFQQAEELGLLRDLAARAGGPPGGTAAPAGGGGSGPAAVSADETAAARPTESAPRPVEPVDVLAAWLLKQADLSDLES